MTISRDCRAMRRVIDEAEPGEALANHAAQHLSVCDSCREFRRQRARLRELVGSLQPVEAPADFDMRLRARLFGERAGSVSWFNLSTFSFGRPALTACAAVIILLGAAILINRTGLLSKTSNQESAARTGAPKQAAPPANEATQPNAIENQKDQLAVVPRESPNGPRLIVPERNRPTNVAIKTNNPRSKDFAVGPAPVIRQDQLERNAAEISLSKPFEFSLEDSRGVSHRISLPPVSFGSQQLIQNGQRYQPTSYSANRVW